MAQTNAQRQATLRLRRRTAGFGRLDQPSQSRLDTWLLADRRWDLEVLATLRGCSVREALEEVIETVTRQVRVGDPEAWQEATFRALESARDR